MQEPSRGWGDKSAAKVDIQTAEEMIDKLNAIRGRRRIRESTLMIFSALGGSAVMYLSMNAFHHKTQKNKFVFGIPLIFAVQCIIIALAYKETFKMNIVQIISNKIFFTIY